MPFAYLLTSKPYGTLYVGSTSDLRRRVWEHKNRVVPGFTARYGVERLVWFEVHESLEFARLRERQIKEWKRAWKIALIEHDNPHWIVSVSRWAQFFLDEARGDSVMLPVVPPVGSSSRAETRPTC